MHVRRRTPCAVACVWLFGACGMLLGGCVEFESRALRASLDDAAMDAAPAPGADAGQTSDVGGGTDPDAAPTPCADAPIGEACSVGVGACAADGVLVCRDGLAECDGAAGQPGDERCNDIDDDCDGQVDEAYPSLGGACTVGQGACEATGTRVCADDGGAVRCEAVAGEPADELCNDVDDDCDGSTDEAFEGLGEPCVVGVGACAAQGVVACEPAGAGTRCTEAARSPDRERCDGEDTDCDGATDEGFDADCQPALVDLSLGRHVGCGRDDDGRAVCWGHVPGVPTPEIPFEQVVVGDVHACGLDAEGVVSCWGTERPAAFRPPAGRFVSLAAGATHFCALDEDGEASCWADPGSDAARPPRADYQAIYAGGDWSCGLLSEPARLECWGEAVAQRLPPPGLYRTAALAARGACAIRRDDDVVVCWDGFLAPPADAEVAGGLSIGDDRACGLDAADIPVCWDRNGARVDAPGGPAQAVQVAGRVACALRSDGVVECVGGPATLGVDVPRAVDDVVAGVAGERALCRVVGGSLECVGDGLGELPGDAPDGLRGGGDWWCGLDGDRVRCFGAAELESPGGGYTSVDVASDRVCAVGAGGAVTCWGRGGAPLPGPDGVFDTIALGAEHGCGVDPEGAVACWGDIEGGPIRPALAVASGDGFSCALGMDATLECWGALAAAPAGRFLDVVATGSAACARAEETGRAVCWGEGPVVDRGPLSQLAGLDAAAGTVCGVASGSGGLVCWGRQSR